MRFADPELLALLALLPLFLWAQRRIDRHRQPALELPALGALKPTRSSWRLRTLSFLPALRLLAVVLIVLALARPQAADADAAIPREGIDIVLTLDVSRSMIQSRIGDELRLDAARRVASDFVAQREDDRIALVVFQAESLVLSPLTVDREAILSLIETSVRQGLVPEGTAVGLALAESVELLRASTAPSRAVVLLTDGEDNIRTVRPVQSARIAEALGILVYTIGVTPSDAPQGVVDELALRFIAERTGGQYFRAAEIADLENAYSAIDALERSKVGSSPFTRYRELSFWFLIPAGALILTELAAHATWWRRAP